MLRIVVLFLLLLIQGLQGAESDSLPRKLERHKQGYKINPYVPEDVWNNLEKYFLPFDHPIRSKLDQIFSKSRVTRNRNSLEEANFKHIKEGQYTGTICARHSKIDGYVIKFFYDEGPKAGDWPQLIRRIEGAKAISETISKHHGYDKIFKVPKKWLYPLPVHPGPKEGEERKNFILVAEEMHVWRRKDSLKKWKTSSMTPLKLKALYKVIKEAGLSDSVYAFNIPFARDGRITFIDTEYYHTWPIHYEHLNRYLSPKMEVYWKELTQK